MARMYAPDSYRARRDCSAHLFVAGSLVWGMVADGFRPSRWDLIGAATCVVGVGIIMLAPRH